MVYWEDGGRYMYLNVYVDCSLGNPNTSKYQTESDMTNMIIYTFPILPTR